MISSKQAFAKFGDPTTESSLIVWDVPTELEIGQIPKKIYCNKAMVQPLAAAFKALIDTGCVNELKTWDGCVNIRKQRGATSMSLHSWGLAIDLNAAWNGMGKQPTLSPEFVKCFTDNGFDWGGNFSNPARRDGMHFQLSNI